MLDVDLSLERRVRLVANTTTWIYYRTDKRELGNVAQLKVNKFGWDSQYI